MPRPEPDTITVPGMPAGAGPEMRRKRDLAIAALAMRNQSTLQEAADVLDRVLDVADEGIQAALRRTPPPK